MTDFTERAASCAATKPFNYEIAFRHCVVGGLPRRRIPRNDNLLWISDRTFPE